ncbi:TonB-dependent hemoglobin/transferrin/lactoferrin family receptor [Alteromonas sp. CYL-A6]|uniref:TonB-dependent hemoglobin/transferrin/lactoferrin family receptor n=1 Tax=Alteromonas nitratireducens TaxID=3390813 RepID=UPI0034AA6F76
MNQSLPAMFTIATLATSVSTAVNARTTLAEPFDGEYVVVSGSRVEQKLKDVAGSVSVITEEAIERQLVASVADMFRYDPGIATTGSGSGPQTVTIRGIGGNRVVYIKDGRRVNDAYAAQGDFVVGRNYFDVDSIRQVEVAKGAASSLYGSDGLGGIVIVTTKDPDDYLSDGDKYAEMNAGYTGTSEQWRAGGSAAVRSGDWAHSAVFSYRNGNEVQNFNETLPGQQAQSTALLLKSVRQLDDKRQFKLTLDYFSQDLEQVIDPQTNATENQDVNWALSFDYESDVATAFYDSAAYQLYFGRYDQQSDQVRFNPRGYTDFNDYGFEQDIMGLRGLFSKTTETGNVTHNLVYGMDVDVYDSSRPRRKTRINADTTVAFENERQKAFPGADTLMAGLFLQDDIQIANSKLALVAGARLDYYQLRAKSDPLYQDVTLQDITEWALSPKLAVKYAFSDTWSGYVQYVRGFKIPPHDQAYQSHGVEPFYAILPNADLEPESSNSYEAGIRYQGNDLSMQFNAFHSRFNDFIESVQTGTEPTFIPGVMRSVIQYRNLDGATIEGVEVSARYHINDNLNISTAAIYTDGTNEDSGQALATISPFQGNVALNYQLDNWALSGIWRIADAMSDVPEDEAGSPLIQSAGYGVVDVFATYSVTNWQLSLAIENLLDKAYAPYERIAGLPSETDVGQFTQPGRTLSANVSYRF